MSFTAIKTHGLPLLPLVIAALLAWGVLHQWVGQGPKTPFNQVALGKSVKEVIQPVQGNRIHCQTLVDGQGCLQDWRKQGSKPVHIWLGNSQLHGINQIRPGDTTAPNHLYMRWVNKPYRLMAFSQPNANLMEHYLLFEALLQTLPIKRLILPVVFDDLREEGIRPQLTSILQDREVTPMLAQTDIGQHLLSLISPDEPEKDRELSGLNQTPQKQIERFFNQHLSNHWNLWDKRSEARGQLFLKLYLFRNQVFGITAQSKRRMIRARYLRNMEALETLLKRAAQADVEVLLYIPPIRNDVSLPYVASEYRIFKDRMRRYGAEKHIHFTSLENLIPAQLWGFNHATNLGGEQELDFMHFRGAGHVQLAEAIDQVITTMDGKQP
ncbi:hypothetical protein [Magnetococcus sp. PR-3]|uniref:hypothetical protein n=1 Tax=Magnetococcus sp. PR-3 TaxID=3120355 RepID=UPI002FCE57C0